MRHLLTVAFLFLLVANCFGPAAASPDSTFGKAVQSYQQKQYVQAIVGFKNCIAVDSEDSTSFYYLGCCLMGLGNLEASDRAFSRCLELQPSNTEAYYATESCREIAQRLNPNSRQTPLASRMVNGSERRRSTAEEKFQQSVVALKQRQRQKLEGEAQNRIDSLQSQIRTIRAEMDRTLGDQPEYFYGRRGRRRSNPYYSYEKNQSQYRISMLERQVSEARRELRNIIERSDSQIDNTFAELASQANATTGNIKPMLTSRSIYVRDYVHFTGDDTPLDLDVTPMRVGRAGKYVGDRAAKATTIANPTTCSAKPGSKKSDVSKQ